LSALKNTGFTYFEEEDTLVLNLVEPGEVTIPLSKAPLRILFERTPEGFRVSLQSIGGDRFLRMLVLKETGPAALVITEKVAERIRCLRLSWDLRDLKIEGLRLGEEQLELEFVSIPLKSGDV